MAPIDVQKVDRPVGNMGQRLVEAAAQQARESPAMRVVMGGQAGMDSVPVEAGVPVLVTSSFFGRRMAL